MPSATIPISGNDVTPTYTTIPISGNDVINRSIQNLSTFLSRTRPWPEFLTVTNAVNIPSSFSDASIRIRRNFKYFSVNYAFVITACIAGSLIGSPVYLILTGLIFALWLILLFFREDPMVVLGHQISDLVVISGLVIVSVSVVWFTGILNNLMIGLGLGFLVALIHGGLRNTEGLFVDENEAVSTGLISNSERG
ncbi:PRA1 family protein G2-like [Lycium barbarum]|uniref:PRA1 family protein G2-like n=1 Tax=Lycium barbarum TaxID=112863 RepID=UPI00293F2FDC|nr:PRA1 family protein G2-like [Lycium barbarum]